jgi:hypothetical protein
MSEYRKLRSEGVMAASATGVSASEEMAAAERPAATFLLIWAGSALQESPRNTRQPTVLTERAAGGPGAEEHLAPGADDQARRGAHHGCGGRKTTRKATPAAAERARASQGRDGSP